MSDLVTEDIAQEFLQLVPQAEYVDVENARHMVAGDRNDIFTEAVLEFVERIEIRR
jgi:pimeloyl-ACP methyl ester carboxylesterase